jgi:DNA adenine methylase
VSGAPDRKVRPIISRHGCKFRLVGRILPLIPPHVCYCEPFAGGLAVLVNKPRSRVEVVNDLDGDLVRLYRCVRYHRDALLDELGFVLNSREEFFAFMAQPGLTDIQRAARWFIRNKLSFGAGMRSWGTSKMAGGAALGSRSSRLDAIRALSARLDSVAIENRGYDEVLAVYDAPTTLFFCDPPYIVGNAKTYAPWKRADMEALHARLLALHGQWLLTTCDCGDCRDIFAGHRLTAVERQNGIMNRPGRQRSAVFRELIIQP